MNKKYIFDYVYLAEASYTDFSKNEKEFDSLTDENNGNLPKSFAELVTKNYTAEAHWQDRGNDSDAELSESGFSGTLFKSTEGKYVLALRGTAGNQDLIETDVGDIVLDGFVLKQSIDLMNFR